MIKFQLLSEYLQSIRLTSTEKINELMKELKLRGLEINVLKLKPKRILSRDSYKSSENKTKPVYILDNSKRWV